jgi:thermopsin
MSYNLRLAALVAFSIAVLMLVSPAASAASPPAAAETAPSLASTIESASAALASSSVHTQSAPAGTESRILSGLKGQHVPMSDVFLPNFNARVSTAGDVVSPLYISAPAPMGIGDFGVQDKGGHNVGTDTYTSSVEGAATLNAVDPLYVTSSAPDEFTIQLNTVLTNVDLFGNTSYNFWIQNVPVYAAGSQTLSFEDNIWNFSSPAFDFTANSIYSHGPGGVVAAPELYYAVGPSFHIPTPFTVQVYNNATIVNDRPTIFFNYTVTYTGGTFSGSYDNVEFNSSATPPTMPAPNPTFQINGKGVNPTQYLLNDAEIMLGGPGGGSTTTLFNIVGSMGLWLLPNGTTTYRTVPAAYDFGTDTGETSEGIAEASTTGPNPTAMLGSGPSILYPLWGIVGAHPGAETIKVNLNPSNAFVFANPGTSFNESYAEWAPTPVSGAAVYVLSPQTYTFRFLLSEYNPVTVTVPLSGGHTVGVTLHRNPSLGDYTPLWAEANSQLAAISAAGGAGTVSNPYVLFNTQAPVSPLFGEVNDFAFPVFPGIYLIDTTAYVSVLNAPVFNLTYLPIQNYNGRLTLSGSPFWDDLNFELYNASHVSIVGSPDISGWFSPNTSFGEPASIYLWNSTHDLIADNWFYVESNGITTSGGGWNTIFGNLFFYAPPAAPDPGSVLNNGIQVALWEFESNDLIYNNAFVTPYTALLFPENFYTGAFQPNMDRFNVSVQPASSVHDVNGWDLSGSILGLDWQGGNYWWNYGTSEDPYMVLPYNDGGEIWIGGDAHPLLPYAIEQIRFHELGLPSGAAWWVDLNGYAQSTTGPTLTFWEPAGAWAFTTGAPGHTAHPASGTETVTTHWVYTYIHFS